MFSRGQKVSRILAKHDGKEAVTQIDDLLQAVYEKKPKKIKKAEKHFILIKRMENQVQTGGFESFYFNASGDHASDTYDALDLIGSKIVKNLFFESMQAFRGMVAKDMATRQKYMEDYKEECTPIWQPLNEVFKKHEEDLDKLLIDYVRAHILEFR
ncbi:DUF4375 domain-containing protein [Acidaminobacter sp. JC074]|uniref:DMP19 family protein n=1 Tax=Acidaminobacter sp. JC074 TaxID=2530199 RepID=UPI001F10CDD1|nr:DUF4375 domain-containing protein [Acidaminobacter sp. JC074]